ncbi:hypothetical protein F5Y11DRAFT_367162 [Daldinia sp. FL1419]|nr:hypothetical protein F5Y11DRAFT_367162 [Daldinia sp. FL1419]
MNDEQDHDDVDAHHGRRGEHRLHDHRLRRRNSRDDIRIDGRGNAAERPHHEEDATPARHIAFWSPGNVVRSLTKDFLKRELPRGVRDRGRISFNDDDTFLPDPMVTFLIDRPKNIQCQICKDITLAIGTTKYAPERGTPAILPCGHVGCHACMGTWVERYSNCPFCRMEMKYNGCQHTVMPALITTDTIATIPKTLPRFGTIADNCSSCQEMREIERATTLLDLATAHIKGLRDSVAEGPAGVMHSSPARDASRDLFESVPRTCAANISQNNGVW